MRYNTVIFDLDGTLLDTLADLTAATGSVLSRFSFPAIDKFGVKERIGDGLFKLMQRCFPNGTDEATIKAAMSYFRNYYANHLYDNTAPYADMIESVTALRAAGVKLAVATNKDELLARQLIERFFGDSFAAVCGACDGHKRKPSGDIPRAALSDIKNPGKILFVGDSHTDLETAQNLGVDFLGVSWGYGNCAGGVFTAEKAENMLNFILL